MPYIAIIRWKGPEPTIELETRHAGFKSPEEAALYANSIPENAPERLRLESNCLRLFSVDGTCKALPFTHVMAWIAEVPQGKGPVLIVDDSDFHRYCGDESNLERRLTAHGDYEITQFAVLGPDGEPINVSVDFEDEDHLSVTVEEFLDGPNMDDAVPLLGTFPKA